MRKFKKLTFGTGFLTPLPLSRGSLPVFSPPQQNPEHTGKFSDVSYTHEEKFFEMSKSRPILQSNFWPHKKIHCLGGVFA